MTAQPEEQKLTLYELNLIILQATDDLERIDDPEVAEALDKAVVAAVAERGEKLDKVAWAIGNAGARADEIDAIADAREKSYATEVSRLRARAEQIRKVVHSMSNSALRVLLTLPLPKKGVRTLEGDTSSFKAYKGKTSVEIYDETAVPPTYRDVTLRVSYEDYLALLKIEAPGLAFLSVKPIFTAPSKTELKRDLERVVKCSECHGGKIDHAVAMLVPCPRCNGLGEVQNEVPGARLVPAKYSLEIS